MLPCGFDWLFTAAESLLSLSHPLWSFLSFQPHWSSLNCKDNYSPPLILRLHTPQHVLLLSSLYKTCPHACHVMHNQDDALHAPWHKITQRLMQGKLSSVKIGCFVHENLEETGCIIIWDILKESIISISTTFSGLQFRFLKVLAWWPKIVQKVMVFLTSNKDNNLSFMNIVQQILHNEAFSCPPCTLTALVRSANVTTAFQVVLTVTKICDGNLTRQTSQYTEPNDKEKISALTHVTH